MRSWSSVKMGCVMRRDATLRACHATNACRTARSIRTGAPTPCASRDQDAAGHVNNVAICAYLETARLTFMRDVGMMARAEDGVRGISAGMTITFLAELHWCRDAPPVPSGAGRTPRTPPGSRSQARCRRAPAPPGRARRARTTPGRAPHPPSRRASDLPASGRRPDGQLDQALSRCELVPSASAIRNGAKRTRSRRGKRLRDDQPLSAVSPAAPRPACRALELREPSPLLVGHEQAHALEVVVEPPRQLRRSRRAPRRRAQTPAALPEPVAQPPSAERIDAIDLVEQHLDRQLLRSDLVQHVVDRLPLTMLAVVGRRALTTCSTMSEISIHSLFV